MHVESTECERHSSCGDLQKIQDELDTFGCKCKLMIFFSFRFDCNLELTIDEKNQEFKQYTLLVIERQMKQKSTGSKSMLFK